MEEYEHKKQKKGHSFGFSIKNTKITMQQCGAAFVWYTIALIIMMGIICVAVFLGVNKGSELVLVPDVVGSNIMRAQLLLQERELYPRLQMRYSDTPGQAGQVISQSPAAGSVVKASSRVTLVVSRGIVFDYVGNYVGTNLDALKTTLDALYAGAEIPSVTIAPPIFKQDASLPGTILEQDPPEGTPITQPVELHFVVSSGSQKSLVQIPDTVGKTVAEMQALMTSSKLIFDFTQHVATGSEVPGTVVKQVNPGNKTNTSEYSRVQIEFAMPQVVAESASDEAEFDDTDEDNYVHGIFSAVIPEYPYAVPVKLDAIPQEGSRYGVVSFNHTGGSCSIPYAVPHGSVLVLNVLNREVERVGVQ